MRCSNCSNATDDLLTTGPAVLTSALDSHASAARRTCPATGATRGKSSTAAALVLKPVGSVISPCRPSGKKQPLPSGLPSVKMLMSCAQRHGRGQRADSKETASEPGLSHALPCCRKILAAYCRSPC